MLRILSRRTGEFKFWGAAPGIQRSAGKRDFPMALGAQWKKLKAVEVQWWEVVHDHSYPFLTFFPTPVPTPREWLPLR
jgi:hypothetical protein